MSIVIESGHTQSHGPSNMNDEIQKVDKLKGRSQCGWFTHTSTLIPCHTLLSLSCTPHLMLHLLLAVIVKSWNFIKLWYETLRLKTKCARLENIYSYNTHNSNSD
jgi:hypothetical protein